MNTKEKKIKKLRLLVTEKCNKYCEMCCNKQWDLKKLPVCKDYSTFDQILLTGGEPMLMPQIIRSIVLKIRTTNQCPIYLYTAKVDKIQSVLSTLFFIDGLTLTLHEQKDIKPFLLLNRLLPNGCRKSLRLNIFEGINLPPKQNFGKWVVKEIQWIENCPLPKNEVFMRYSYLKGETNESN